MKAIMRIVLAVSRLVINVILILNIMHSLKGGYRDFFILSEVPLDIIYGGKIVETVRSDLKTT